MSNSSVVLPSSAVYETKAFERNPKTMAFNTNNNWAYTHNRLFTRKFQGKRFTKKTSRNFSEKPILVLRAKAVEQLILEKINGFAIGRVFWKRYECVIEDMCLWYISYLFFSIFYWPSKRVRMFIHQTDGSIISPNYLFCHRFSNAKIEHSVAQKSKIC